MRKSRNLLLILLLLFFPVLTTQAYDLALEKGEFSLGLKPLFSFGSPDKVSGETPYYYAGILEFKYAIFRNLEVFAAYEGYNLGNTFEEDYSKIGLSFYISKRKGFGMCVNAAALPTDASVTPYTITGEIIFKGKLF